VHEPEEGTPAAPPSAASTRPRPHVHTSARPHVHTRPHSSRPEPGRIENGCEGRAGWAASRGAQVCARRRVPSPSAAAQRPGAPYAQSQSDAARLASLLWLRPLTSPLHRPLHVVRQRHALRESLPRVAPSVRSVCSVPSAPSVPCASPGVALCGRGSRWRYAYIVHLCPA
jgi:hypothetical protein